MVCQVVALCAFVSASPDDVVQELPVSETDFLEVPHPASLGHFRLALSLSLL